VVVIVVVAHTTVIKSLFVRCCVLVCQFVLVFVFVFVFVFVIVLLLLLR